LELKEWAKALKFFQKSRIYSPNDSKSLKGIIECSWQKTEYSRVAQLCSTLVKNATSEADVILGYLWRGFTLDAKLQRQELAEQHYWRVLEYDQNHPVALLYVSGISMRKTKWKSMFGQLSQAWNHLSEANEISVDSMVEETIVLGRYIAAQKVEDTEAETAMLSWLENRGIALDEAVDAQFLERLTLRMFGL
jgi:tetratricopeptide (TPR) repeat protein